MPHAKLFWPKQAGWLPDFPPPFAHQPSAPQNVSRLRAIGDSGVRDNSNFGLRRVRLAVQGDVNEFVSTYLRPDFAVAVSNQTTGERREGFVQLQRSAGGA